MRVDNREATIAEFVLPGGTNLWADIWKARGWAATPCCWRRLRRPMVRARLPLRLSRTANWAAPTTVPKTSPVGSASGSASYFESGSSAQGIERAFHRQRCASCRVQRDNPEAALHQRRVQKIFSRFTTPRVSLARCPNALAKRRRPPPHRRREKPQAPPGQAIKPCTSGGEIGTPNPS
jgi:hypothetical protein